MLRSLRISIAQVRVGDYMEGSEVFFNNTLISVKTIHAIKGKNLFSRKFRKCYDNQEYHWLMKVRKKQG